MIKKNWKSKVYRRRRERLPENWKEIREEIWKRDNYTCFRCLKHEARGQGLTVHHLLPRIEGGGENPENLVTLCRECQDFVEIQDLRTLTEILGSIDLGVQIREEKVIPNEESFQRPEWHKWVYGGCKKSENWQTGQP